MPTPEDTELLKQQNEANAASALSIIKAAIKAAEKGTAPHKMVDIADIDFSGAEISLSAPVTIQANLTFERLLDETAISSGTLTINGTPIVGISPVEYVSPGSSWNGTAGSGFTSTPVDPTRVTAKPACRLLVVPHQYFTDEILVGVIAAANDGGSLYNNLGLQKVRVHYEGTVYDIERPTLRSIICSDGKQHTYLGWWVMLKHNGTNGSANVYFEAIPRDTTMQNRVMGPYFFYPSATLYDYDLIVAPSLAEVAGSRYQTLKNALTYLKGVSAQNPRVTYTETGDYEISTLGELTVPYRTQKGWCTVRATVPVTFKKASFDWVTATMNVSTRYAGIKWTGSNITFDMKNIAGFVMEISTVDASHSDWWDGINFINSAGRNYLWAKGARPSSTLHSDRPWMTECTTTNVEGPGRGTSLTRGCSFDTGLGDVVTGSSCIVGTVTHSWDSDWWRTFVPAMTVQYVGAGATATLTWSGNGSSTTRTMTAKVDGTTVGTFVADQRQTAYASGVNFDVADVVAWVNTLSGWTATLLDDTRRACALMRTTDGGSSGFTNADVKTAPLTLATRFDLHPDWYQAGSSSIYAKNVVIYDNLAYDFNRGQMLYISDSGGKQDFMVFNNCWHVTDDTFTTQSNVSDTHSHTVIAHNSWAGQRFSFRYDVTYAPDSYCSFKNNVAEALLIPGYTSQVAPEISGNHIYAGTTPTSIVANSTVDGDKFSLFTSAATGDFTPQGALLTYYKTPIVKRDISGKFRGISAPAGAIV